MKTFQCSLLLVLLFLLAFQGCGKFSRIENGKFTTVTINRRPTDRFSEEAVMVGGIMVYAYSQDYAKNGILSDETGALTLTLPNGTYSFYAFGYSQTFGTTSSDNDVRCAVVTPVNLTGASQDITITLKQSDCSNGAFTANGAYTDSNSANTAATASTLFPPIEVLHCSSTAGTALATISATNDCSTVGGTGITAPWTAVQNYEVRLPLYERAGLGFTRIGEGLVSPCASAYPSPSGYPAGSEYKRLPLGSTNFPFLFPVEFYTYGTGTNACSSGNPLARNNFHRSLIFGPDPDASYMGTVKMRAAATNQTRIYLREP